MILTYNDYPGNGMISKDHKSIPLDHANRGQHVLDNLARQTCPECGGGLQVTGAETLEATCPFCGWSSMYRRSSFLSRSLRNIIQGNPDDFHFLQDASAPLLSSIPLTDYRYNHRYPFLLHKDARRIVVPAADSASATDPQTRLTSGTPVVQAPLFRVVRGLDTLKVSFWLKWNHTDNDFFGILDFMKKKVQDTENDCIPVFKENCFDWNLYRSGARMYTFRLRSGDITLMFNRRKSGDKIPNCRLEIGSLSCWSPGFFSIYERVKAFLAAYGAEIAKERVSEVHLAADFIGTDIKFANLDKHEHWIAFARKDDDHGTIPVQQQDTEPEPDELDFDKHYDCRKFSGLNIGKGDLMLRIYDKGMELKRTRATHKQQVFSEIWSLEKYDDQPVTRVEYQIRRPKLREFSDHEGKQIDTVSDLLNAIRSLWAYLTTEWTRHTQSPVNRNHNQSKAKVSEFWQKVQTVVWFGVFGYIRTHPVKHRDTAQLRSMARGCLMSVCASLEVEPDDIDKIVYLCKDMIEEDLHSFFENEQEFRQRMISRRNEFRATLAG